jgi:hypothetical protein
VIKTLGPIKTQKSGVYAYGYVVLEVNDFRSFTTHGFATDVLQVLSNELPLFNLKEDLHVIVELILAGRSPRPDGRVVNVWLDDVAWAYSWRWD